MISVHSQTNAFKLYELRQSIEKFRIVSCGLNHETLVADKVSGLPVFYDLSGQKVFSNIGFCQRKERGSFLQCAHSMAWYRFLDCLNDLKLIDQTGDLYLPVEQVKEVMLRIFELDHQKSTLEKRKANLLYEPNNEAVQQTDHKITECFKEHSDYVRTLEMQRKLILQSIDSNIKSMRQ